MTQSKPKKVESLLEIIRNCIKSGRYRDTIHAAQRQEERKITLPEILYVLNTGRHEKSKDRFEKSFNAWNYAIRGLTLDGLDVRVIVSFNEEKDLLLITVFDIEGRG